MKKNRESILSSESVGVRQKQLIVKKIANPCSSHMIQTQMKMAERALELLALPDDQPSYILDIG